MTTEQLDVETIHVSPHELLHPEWIVLRTIAKAGEAGIHVTALADELAQAMSKVTVIRALAKLEQRQLVRADWIKDSNWKRKYFIANRRVQRLVSRNLEPLFTAFSED